MKTARKIAMFGTFDVPNYGDCIFPDIVRHRLGVLGNDVELTLYSPAGRVSPIGSYDEVREIPGSLDEVESIDADACLIAGGEVLVDRPTTTGVYADLPRNQLSAGPRCWLVPAHLAATRGLPLAYVSVGQHGLRQPSIDALRHAMAGASYAAVRDPFTQDVLSTNAAAPRLEPDIGFLIPTLRSPAEWDALAAPLREAELVPGKPYLAVQFSAGYVSKSGDAFFAAAAEIAKARDLEILLLPLCYHLGDDYVSAIAQTRFRRAGVEASRVRLMLPTAELAAVLRAADGFVGTSLHGAMTTLAFGKPAAIFCKSNVGKHVGCMQTAGLSGIVTTEPTELATAFATAGNLDLTSRSFALQKAAGESLDAAIRSLGQPEELTGDEPLYHAAARANLADIPRGPSERVKAGIYRQLRRNRRLSGYFELTKATCRALLP